MRRSLLPRCAHAPSRSSVQPSAVRGYRIPVWLPSSCPSRLRVETAGSDGGRHLRPFEQRELQNFVAVSDEVEGHLLAHVAGDLFEITLVLLRKDHSPKTGAVRGEHLLLDPTDR